MFNTHTMADTQKNDTKKGDSAMKQPQCANGANGNNNNKVDNEAENQTKSKRQMKKLLKQQKWEEERELRK